MLIDYGPMDTIVEIENVTAWRGRTRVFHGLDLTLERGTSTAVLGPNGAGKSTLLKLLSREIYPEHTGDSAVRLFGRERWNVWKLRERLGMVSHDLHTDYRGSVTGRDVVLSGFHASQGVPAHHDVTDAQRAAAEAVIERLNLAALSGRAYASMSTGEQRRFLLGRALVHDPEVLVLDEPTSGIDLRACFEYLALVRELIRDGKTVVLATHHIHEIPPEVERVVLLRDGEVVADGPREEVLTDELLSRTFDTPVEVVRARGYYRAVPGEDGLGTLRQGYLEDSSVDAVREVTELIEAQRAYELNAKIISAADQMLGATTQVR